MAEIVVGKVLRNEFEFVKAAACFLYKIPSPNCLSSGGFFVDFFVNWEVDENIGKVRMIP